MTLSRKWKSLPLSIAAGLIVTWSAAASAEPLKVAFVYLGPVKDGGWTQMHDEARLKLEKAMGDKIKTTLSKMSRRPPIPSGYSVNSPPMAIS